MIGKRMSVTQRALSDLRISFKMHYKFAASRDYAKKWIKEFLEDKFNLICS